MVFESFLFSSKILVIILQVKQDIIMLYHIFVNTNFEYLKQNII